MTSKERMVAAMLHKKPDIYVMKRCNTNELKMVMNGLKILGIDNAWQIVLGDNRGLVEEAAAQELKEFLARVHVNLKIVPENDASSGEKIILGTIKSSCRIKTITKEGTLKIGNVSSEDDGFHLKSVGPDMVMAGANPRGVLYAVYRLEDWLRGDRPNHKSLDIFEVPYFKMRFMPCIPNDKEAIKYLSRLGVNASSPSANILPYALHEYVESDVFPNIIDRKRLCHNKTELRSILDLFKMYGIDAYLWPICEPIVLKKKDSPSDRWWQSGVVDANKFPEEVQGIRKSSRGFDIHTLCINHPDVQAHYTSMIKKFVREFPEVKGMLVYNDDAGAWFCDTWRCPICRKALGTTGTSGYAIENHVKLMRILQQGANEVNPGFTVFVGPWHWTHDKDLVNKMLNGIDARSGLWASAHMADTQVVFRSVDPNFTKAMDICKRRGLKTACFDAFLTVGDDFYRTSGGGFPAPFSARKKFQIYRQYGKNIIDHWGQLPVTMLGINELVWKEFSWDPGKDRNGTIKKIAVFQFGDKAGKKMYNAWEILEEALKIWGNMGAGRLYSLDRLHHYVYNCHIFEPLKIQAEKNKNNLNNAASWKTALTIKDSRKIMNGRYLKALSLMEESIKLAGSKTYPFYRYYLPESGRDCKSYAQQLCNQVRIVRWIQLNQYHLLCAVELLRKMDRVKEDGKKSAALNKKLFHLERQELENTKSIIPAFESLLKLQPGLVNHGLPIENYDPEGRFPVQYKIPGQFLVNFDRPDYILMRVREKAKRMEEMKLQETG